MEVEKKSTTPYSPKGDSKRSRKAEDSLFLRPLSIFLQLLWTFENQCRIGKKAMMEITKVDKRKIQNSFSGAIINRFSTFHQFTENWPTRFFQTASRKASKTVKDTLRMLKIIVFLHSAEDMQSVLRLYGIQNSDPCQSPNEM